MSVVQTHHFLHNIILRIQLHFHIFHTSFFYQNFTQKSFTNDLSDSYKLSYWSPVTAFRRLFICFLSLSPWFFTEIFLMLSVTVKVALRTASFRTSLFRFFQVPIIPPMRCFLPSVSRKTGTRRNGGRSSNKHRHKKISSYGRLTLSQILKSVSNQM